MRAGQKVLMRSPSGKVKPVAVEDSAAFRELGFTMAPRSNEVAQRLQAFGTEAKHFTGRALPIATGAATGLILGGPAGAGVGALRGAAIEGLISGASAIPGQMLQDKPTDPVDAVVQGGISIGGGLVGRGVGRLVKAIPKPAMKAALGNALPGTEDLALGMGQSVSNAGLAARNAGITAAEDAAQAAIDSSPRRYSWGTLRRVVSSLKGRAAKSDIISDAEEMALADAERFLAEKLGPQTTTTPASSIVAPGRGGLRATSGPAIPSTSTTTPAKPMTARDLEDIRKYSDDQVMRFREAREANKSTVLGPDEMAYAKIADRARKMLAATIPEVKKARLSSSQQIQVRDATFEALKRSPRMGAILSGGWAGSSPGMFMHDPMVGALGALTGAGVGASASSPAGLSAIANAANNPAVQQGARQLPRALQLLLTEAMSRGQGNQ